MVNKNVVFRYIDSMYCSEVGNLYSKPPRITTLAYATSHSYHAFSDAAFGAFIEGNTGLKDKFHDMAKKVYTEIDKADILDMTVTAGDLALGAMSLYSGSIEEANKYLLRANKTASRYTVEINQETTGKDRALCRILMFHQLKFTSSPAKQKDIVESLVSGLLSECDGQVGLLSVSDRTMLVLVLSLKVISSIRYIQEQGRSITVAEKAMFYLLLTQAEEGSRYPVATHARVLLHLARTSISIASRNNDRAFKHAERALSILMEMDPSSTVLSTFLLKSLIEVFATIECAEKFMVCLDLMRDLSTKWSLARLMSNVVLAMVSRVPPNAVVDSYKRYSNLFKIFNVHSVAAMLQKLQEQGCNLLASEPLFAIANRTKRQGSSHIQSQLSPIMSPSTTSTESVTGDANVNQPSTSLLDSGDFCFENSFLDPPNSLLSHEWDVPQDISLDSLALPQDERLDDYLTL
eukprot:CAMPEP_0168525750 /NCGR_PEP_ID=MMETSP0405-20121227/11504_1 /TAXON_ID=498012 /ORGANISM="Trichosphaerium sp, Strain Am-I-7 wt" /LENGTH=462 /DNA_ID=CAMNT_0008548353 /DNA_START=321 /DNA_END=1709 /DNA_ORIENTATION=-